MKVSKKIIIVPVILAALTGGWIFTSAKASAGNDWDYHTKAIVGAWEVQAIGAPYEPHLFTFHIDGTMTTTNPTNVQEDPSAPHGGTNDSVGMGKWKYTKKDGQRYIVGTFEQLNAFADDHTPTDKLSVTFKIKVDGDTFEGPAIAKQGALSAPATLEGKRIMIDQTTLNEL